MRKTAILLGTVAAVLAIASCGSSTPAAPTAAAAPGAAKITITDAFGPVELAAPATRVVSLEWTYTEELLALGVAPVGVADMGVYNDWVTAGPRVAETTLDVGTRQEPNLETIASLKPDLIVGAADRFTSNLQSLKDIAPVLAFRWNDPAKPQLTTMRESFLALAEAVGKDAKASEVLAGLDATMASAKTKLSTVGKTFALAYPAGGAGAATVTVFAKPSLASQILEAAGMTNGWTGTADGDGLSTVGVEALTGLPADVNFLYVSPAGDDTFVKLADNKVWTGLPFVQAAHTYLLDPTPWFYGGPLSAEQLLTQTVATLVK
ncbi:iron-siderophore ABC transporter substrate-binding protein [Acrocarpospora macrocephala]|uniref:Ferrichrome ABC transporter substrate-binding protein n=1 Tax=Acrocarpospora macrocephala TaxID=150177 RepID=A0A5M3WKM7_9ACTN|nr:iron-siderophore ABC transporter substrate-binding protein [Acrocarpospora macrocephala]GES09777.1 ferrichrome ABC transporter substrate-binding protein [Acrocarpospora macrocephala]